MDDTILRRAAAAVGYDFKCYRGGDPALGSFLSSGGAEVVKPGTSHLWYWAPHRNGSDALHLAAALRISLSWDRYDDVDYAVATPFGSSQGMDAAVDQDDFAAACRAITLAAASLAPAADISYSETPNED